MELTVGAATYRLVTVESDGQFTACAVRIDTNERFGIETVAAHPEDAQHRLAEWLQWQHEHTQALEALQQAERTYHRAIAGAAFATPEDDSTAAARLSLDSVNAARAQLDEVRARRPTV
jgi:uncharacterized protein (DUF1684 family)